jgi:hypothetical protein
MTSRRSPQIQCGAAHCDAQPMNCNTLADGSFIGLRRTFRLRLLSSASKEPQPELGEAGWRGRLRRGRRKQRHVCDAARRHLAQQLKAGYASQHLWPDILCEGVKMFESCEDLSAMNFAFTMEGCTRLPCQHRFELGDDKVLHADGCRCLQQ